LLYGGRDSGKSYSIAQKIIANIMGERYCKVVCLRKIYADIKDSQFDTIWTVIQSYGLEHLFHYTIAPLQITCLLNYHKIMARGLDRPTKLKSINNPSIVWVEEADEITKKDFTSSNTSIRAPKGNLLQFIMTFNPELEEGWISEEFFPHKSQYEIADGKFNFIESIKPDTTIMHSTYLDNDFCPPERGKIYEELAGDGDQNYYNVYCLGLWGNALKGLVFESFNYADKFPERQDCKHYGYGLDFGFTNDPTSLIRCALAHGELWYEEVVYKRGLTNTGERNSIVAEFQDNEISKNDDIIADSAEPKSIQELRNAGYRVIGIKKPKDSIEAGITSMKRYPINIVGASPNLRKEFKSYKYKESKMDDSEFTNKPIDAWNHGIDASRYWTFFKIGKLSMFDVL